MLMKRNSLVFSLCLLFLLAGVASPALAQDDGMPLEGEVVEDLEADVFPPPDGLDEFQELNPVSQETLENLASTAEQSTFMALPDSSFSNLSESASSDDVFVISSVFQKYTRLPSCTSTGCPGGVDHMSAGTSLRNTGYGTIRLRGVPPTATAVSAFLYFGIIDNTTPVPNPLVVSFNGTNVQAFLVGTAPSPCWGNGTFRAYRAIVLPLLAAGINADYRVRGVPSSVTNGQCPWGNFASAPLAEGASLVVLYTDPSVPQGTQVQIHHPPVTQVFGTTTYTHFLNFPINFSAVKHTRLGADGQTGIGCPGAMARVTGEQTFLGGPLGTGLTQIRGIPGAPNTDSDWNGTDGEPLNQLWDTHLSPASGTIPAGVAQYRVQYRSPGDCIVPVAHVLTYR